MNGRFGWPINDRVLNNAGPGILWVGDEGYALVRSPRSGTRPEEVQGMVAVSAPCTPR